MASLNNHSLGIENFADSKKIRVLLLTWEFPPHIVGGLARHTEGLSRSLQKNGVEVYVITAKPQSLDPDYEEVEGVKVYRVAPLNAMDERFLNWIGGLNLAMVQRALELNEGHHFDLIHAHDWLVGEAGRQLSFLLGLPLITTIHATEHGRHTGIYTELQKFIHDKELQLVQASDQLIVCSEFMKEEVSELFVTEISKISVIPNGVTTDNSPTNHSLLFHPLLNEKRRIIFSIGRLVREKGFDLIIEAARKINSEDVCFVIAGKGPSKQELTKLITEYGLENTVHLVDFITDQQRDQFFERSILSIFPSRYEPFGIVALEAMKMECPVIVSDTGGLRGFVKDKDTGLLIKPDDVSSLVEQIKWVLSNPEQTQMIASKGKELVSTLYSWNRVGQLTKRLYEESYLLKSIQEEIGELYKIKN